VLAGVGIDGEHDADVRLDRHHRTLGRVSPWTVSTAWNATFTVSALVLSWFATVALFMVF
jgi:hypothetical protein